MAERSHSIPAAGFHLRPFRRADLEKLYQIDQVCFSPGIAYSKAELRYYLQHPKSFTVIAENAADQETGDPNIVGFCTTQRHLHEGSHFGHLITIDVLPEARRQGTGRLLLMAVEEHLRASAVQWIRLEVAVDNAQAQCFYLSMGYETIGRIPNYYLGRLDALVMQKHFTGDV